MAKEKHRLGRHGKKYSDAIKKIEKEKNYNLNEALELVDQVSFAKFDETVEVCFNLGVDPRHADQMVRGAVVLPHGTGSTVRIAVVAKGDKAKEAEAAGADIVGADDLIEKIQGGWLEFDRMIATPDMMVGISKVGRILGPKGLMPNPKLGLVTFDVAKAIDEQKKGKVEYRTEKTGLVHVPIGKKSFGKDKLKANFLAVAGAVIRAKPTSSKGTYLKKMTLSTTMSPGLGLDVANVASEVQSAD